MRKLPFVLSHNSSLRMDGPFLWKSTKPQNTLRILKLNESQDLAEGMVQEWPGIQKAPSSIHSKENNSNNNKWTIVLCLETETLEDAQEIPVCSVFVIWGFCGCCLFLSLHDSYRQATVTPRDKAIQLFSRYLPSLYPGHGNSYSVRKNTGSLKVKRTEVIYFGLVSFFRQCFLILTLG